MSHLNSVGSLICFMLAFPGLLFSQEEIRRIKVSRDDAIYLQRELGWIADELDSENGLFSLTPDEVGEMAQTLHEKRGRCGGFKDVTDGDFSFPVHPFISPSKFVDTLDPRLEFILQSIGEKNMEDTITALSDFPTRRYDSDYGKEAAESLAQRLQALAVGREDISVTSFTHSWPMPSVIARIRGTVSPEESVIVGGHLDSINKLSFSEKAPGADDDASGVAAAFEAFRAIVASGVRPTRTLEFMAYSAEEVGLRGSQEIAESYQIQRRQVRAVMQLDMVAYAGSGDKIFLITDNIDQNLNATLKEMAEKELGFTTGWTKCGYSCSDHVSWTDAGYPAVIPFEARVGEHNPNLHTEKDVSEILSMVYAKKFAQLATLFYWDLGVVP